MVKMSIENLFGRFNYVVHIRNLEEDGLTILTGPNGFGKSTILNCIDAISNSDLPFFSELRFDLFEVEKKENKIRIENKGGNLIVNGCQISEKDIVRLKRGVNVNGWSSTIGTIEEKRSLEQIQKNLRQMQDFFGKVLRIREQRLVELENRKWMERRYADVRARAQKEIIEKIDSIPEKLKNLMSKLDSNYSKLSNELDSTFPKRLFQLKDGIDQKEFSEKIDKMKECIGKLNVNGILKIQTLDDVEFKKEDARALKIYFEDFDKKYQVYEQTIEQLDLFREMVNKHFKFKSLEIEAEKGLRVIDADTRDEIRLNCLSSGEQEIIILYYSLLFDIPKGMLVLVDEPEISLHIAWQRMFVEDLKRILKLKKISAIIATHSPQIISGNRNIQYDLGEMYKNGLCTRK